MCSFSKVRKNQIILDFHLRSYSSHTHERLIKKINTHNVQKVVHVRPLVHEKPHRMPVDGDFDGEVMWRAGFHRVPWHRVVMRVDQRLVQVQYQRFALNHPKSVPGNRREREQFIFHRLMLYKLRQSDYP